VPLFKKSKAKRLAKAEDVAGLLALATGPESPSERADALNALASFDEEAAGPHYGDVLRAVRTAVRDPSADVRTQALFALGELRPPGAVDDLLAAVDDTDWGARLFSVILLAHFPEARATARLIAVVDDDEEGLVREAAASSLGDLADPEAIEPLRRAANQDPEREVRKAAKEALRKLEKMGE
jgi:HEAT repeat protein